MRYSKAELRKIIGNVLKTAQDNLIKHGYLQPVGLIFTAAGMRNIFEFHFQGTKEKRLSQLAFKKLVANVGAHAVVVITESWIKMHPDVPLELDRPVAEMPGREESIVIEAVSHNARVILVQVFRKEESGITFDDLIDIGDRYECTGEWTDGLKLRKAEA
jgi:hypothetical protein